jgi:ABC-type antimicrobial peptide transport system permease subunit
VPGVVTGLALAALLAGRVSPLLFGVGPRDVATYASVALLAAAVALVAALLPARRAASIAPIEALRAE